MVGLFALPHESITPLTTTKRLLRLGILCVPTIDDEVVTTLTRAMQRVHAPTVLVMATSALSQRNWLEELLCTWCDVEELDLVLTVGGTLPAPGPSAAEIVPEVTRAVVERLVPGLAEAMRHHAQQVSALAWLERGIVGIRGRSLVVNLPAGAAPALLFLEAIAELVPVVLGHLQEDSTAPQLQDELVLEPESTAVTAPVPDKPVPAAGKGLRADEFAAFLARKQATHEG